jgi:flagellar motor switch protein FliM
MNSPGETPNQPGPFATSDVENLLDSVAKMEQEKAPSPSAPPEMDGVQPCDFRNPSLLSPRKNRKLRLHEEEFARNLASRLSSHLRLEFAVELTGLRTITCQKFAESWANPTHLTLFKLEPLRGICALEISPQLGAIMVDRLMGGPGHAAEVVQEMSEIEMALLEQTVQLLIEEWRAQWLRIKELKPAILGCETSGQFVHLASSETVMLVLSLSVIVGDHTGRIQIGFPFAALEPLIDQLTQSAMDIASAPKSAPAASAPNKWNPIFDEVSVPVSAEWEGLEMTAREVLALKIGDVVPLNPQRAHLVNVRLAELAKFQGRPGAVAGHWAVELTHAIKH